MASAIRTCQILRFFCTCSLPNTGPIQTGYEEKLAMYRSANSPLSGDHSLTLVLPACTSRVMFTHGLAASSYSSELVATVGNVTSPRPGIWDMLARAKWDAWAKQKDLDPQEAKWRYVETLMKVCVCHDFRCATGKTNHALWQVLRKYSDKTVARDLVQELESYGGQSSIVTDSKRQFLRACSMLISP